jgi:hypothetical protein
MDVPDQSKVVEQPQQSALGAIWQGVKEGLEAYRQPFIKAAEVAEAAMGAHGLAAIRQGFHEIGQILPAFPHQHPVEEPGIYGNVMGNLTPSEVVDTKQNLDEKIANFGKSANQDHSPVQQQSLSQEQ